MLGQLILKDLRICRLPVFAWVLLVLGAYLVPVITLCGDLAKFWNEGAIDLWIVVLKSGSALCSFTSVAALTMVSGTIFAAERADRSAEFLAALPPSRVHVLLSKLSIVVGLTLISALIGSGGSVFADWLVEGEARSPLEAPWKVVVALNCLLIGVAWFCSAVSTSSGMSVAVGLLSPLILLAVLQAANHLVGYPDSDELLAYAFWTAVTVGLTSMLSGCVYFTRRLEP